MEVGKVQIWFDWEKFRDIVGVGKVQRYSGSLKNSDI